MIAPGTDAVLGTPGGVDDHMIACLAGVTRGVKIIYLLPGAELDVHDLRRFRGSENFVFHGVTPLYSYGQSRYIPQPRSRHSSQPQMAAGDTLPWA